MRLISSVLGLVLLSGSAMAADLLEPVVPVEPVVVPEAFSWTGGYIGADLGWAWGAGSDDGGGNDAICIGRRGGNCHYADYDNVDELRGWFAGVDAGFLYQTGMFVVGVEGDLKWADIDTGNNDDYYYGYNGHRRLRVIDRELNDGRAFRRHVGGFDSDHGISVDWLGTARLSAGVAFDRTLIYGTGGLAFGGLEVNRSFGNSDDDTELGWTLGAGAKYAVTDNVAIGAEYKYINFNVDGDDGDGGAFNHRLGRRFNHRDSNPDIDLHTITAKVDFLF